MSNSEIMGMFTHLDDGERDLVQWLYRKSGFFMTKLFECISMADENNLARLAKAYPRHVDAFRLYRADPGYHADVVYRYNVMNNTSLGGA
jgi:hypothetical protein